MREKSLYSVTGRYSIFTALRRKVTPIEFLINEISIAVTKWQITTNLDSTSPRCRNPDWPRFPTRVGVRVQRLGACQRHARLESTTDPLVARNIPRNSYVRDDRTRGGYRGTRSILVSSTRISSPEFRGWYSPPTSLTLAGADGICSSTR